nr:GNAT family N-acetyltransferase [Rhodocytophaga rosea]
MKIGAQLYAKAFYEQFGFVQAGKVYDEDGIDHIPMIRT